MKQCNDQDVWWPWSCKKLRHRASLNVAIDVCGHLHNQGSENRLLTPTGRVAGLGTLAMTDILSYHESENCKGVILIKLIALWAPLIRIMKLQNQNNWTQIDVFNFGLDSLWVAPELSLSHCNSGLITPGNYAGVEFYLVLSNVSVIKPNEEALTSPCLYLSLFEFLHYV
jgi:hypothetical protein